MKKLFYLILIVSTISYGQESEFQTFPNGLIYDEQTMSRLELIVDSLNLKFKACDLAHPYYSHYQGFAYFVSITSKAVRDAISNGISFDQFVQKYPANVEEKLWLVKLEFTNRKGTQMISYSGLPYGYSDQPSITVKKKHTTNKTSGWVMSDSGEEAVFLTGLAQYELPYKLARLVQYVDCMIDTTSQIYFPNAGAEVYQMVTQGSKAQEFMKWAQNFPDRPEFPDYDKLEREQFEQAAAEYEAKHSHWDSLRLAALDQKMSSSHYWRSVLIDAAEDGLASGNTDEWLEFYVARYLSKEKALQLKRSRKVMGGCSMDLSPRYHAVNICKLAAETAKWDIFLRAHLDVMNDRFDRQSDGSYAWAGRKTYLKELEELDIEAIDLLLGTALAVENVSTNHYQSSIGRAGRALADAKNKDQPEARLTSIVEDENLDPYNRLLMAYLFHNYTYNLDDEARKVKNNEKLRMAVNAMPLHIREVWKK